MDVYHIVRRPLVTEKGTHQSKQSYARTRTRPGRGGAYSFEVHPDANRIEIKDAVEKIYNVKVQDVRTSMRRGKYRRYRYKSGITRHWKKAVVVLKPQYHIDLF
ncbi:MAG: 50S ribosomal protein L23 [Phycisphaerae bacterium]|nr:50S ribosomal protein L23 [Phycisphaerae bacterium]